MSSKKQWQSAHLYYAEPWHHFLTKFLKPWIAYNLEKEGIAYFFIQYWERGPHIRFRYLLSAEQAEILNLKLQQDFNTFCKNHPSSYGFENPAEDFLAHIEKEWYPNNSLQFIDYEPETERYGGPQGLALSERHFKASSSLVLDCMADDEDWDYNAAFGASIQAHVLLCRALGYSTEDMQEFFHYIFLSWYPRAIPEWAQLSESEQLAKRDELFSAFEEQYKAQQSQLQPFISSLWNEVEEDFPELLEDYVLRWYHHAKVLKAEMDELYQKGQLNNPGWIRSIAGKEIGEEKATKWAIISSYIHMTNNRMGVQNRDEGYIGYIIKSAFSA